MDPFDAYCAHQAGLPLPTAPSASSDRGHPIQQQMGGEDGREEGGEGDGKGDGQEKCGACTHPFIEGLGKENERLRKQMKKDQAYLAQLVGYGLELTNKLLEERADHAREVAALKEAHLDEMKEAYCRMPAQVIPKRAGEGLSPPTSPEKRVCLSEDASQQEVRDRGHTGSDTTPPTARLGVWVDDGDAPTIKSLDEVAPELRPDVESWVERWRSNALATKTLKGKTLDGSLPSKNCVAQRSKGASSEEFYVDGKPVIYISCANCTGHHRMCCRRDPSFREQNLPYDFVLSPLAPELRGNTQPCDRGHYVFDQVFPAAMKRKYGKAAAISVPSPSDGVGNNGAGTRLSAGNVAST
ncbi:hypothetical protein KC340_g6160 [Hortaea werneckii]|nr:hypothetical protein KC342_g3417 [Hortaea werneckii]KAI7099136.1 hypothetical protein KC339_g8452 [Hortaea werneckii]KAI7239456.1 hypothetical protein KC365_g4087 [Hortaea werneckii]KAI7325261.1 hypothetical protein KC340_g6160 [Hortaea werneckii]KAI7385705.1 hypothetical protein KC328_g10204 [Hortaea werneckii]